MSHPYAHLTYEDELLDQWSEDELERLWELYTLDCERSQARPTMSDYIIFLQERV